MALVVKDRVKETTTTTGTGSLSLNGAAAGFQSFEVIGNGNTTYYAITDTSTSAWEVGLGTYTSSGAILARTTVLSSSNGGAAVNFGAGSKDVFVTYPAERAVIEDGSGNVTATSFTGDGSALSNVAASTATTLQTARTIGGVSFDGSANINLPGVNAAGNQSTTGNAATATVLQTARTIGGVSFNGSANINLPGVNAAGNQNTTGNAATATNVAYSGLTGTVPTWNQNTTGNAATATNVAYSGLTGAVPTWNQNTTGNAATATKLATARTIGLSGDVSGSVSFDGSANATITAVVADDSHNHIISNVDGLQAALDSKQPTGSYLTGNQTITLSGDVSGSGTTSISVTVADDSHNHIISNVDGLQTALDGKAGTTGSGASGTWGISITGNAATATLAANSTLAGGLAVGSGVNNSANQIVRTNASGYADFGWINTVSGNNDTIAIDRVYASHDGYIRYYTPTNFRTVLDVPTRGGSGASGTWGINVTGSSGSTTGNASTATTLQTARTINGVSFNGSSNITVFMGGPAFRAYMVAAQSISAFTFTKLNFSTEVFDTNSNYNTSTYRFTPTVAGYYQIAAFLYVSSTFQLYILKNGSTDATGQYSSAVGNSVSSLVYLNGSSDYVEVYYYGNSVTTPASNAGANQFTGVLVRAA